MEPEVIDGADMDTPISTRDMEKVLGGLKMITDAKTMAAGLVAEGYDAPRAWVNPVRDEVKNAGVKGGHVECVMRAVRILIFLLTKLGEVFCGELIEAGVVTADNEEKLRQQMDSCKSFPSSQTEYTIWDGRPRVRSTTAFCEPSTKRSRHTTPTWPNSSCS